MTSFNPERRRATAPELVTVPSPQIGLAERVRALHTPEEGRQMLDELKSRIAMVLALAEDLLPRKETP